MKKISSVAVKYFTRFFLKLEIVMNNLIILAHMPFFKDNYMNC